jgi:predicted dehydrogenase
VKKAHEFTSGAGMDAVLITAATKSNDVMRHSAQMSRKRGRIVLTGVVGLDLDRADFYEKELTFQVSCSYGPGRYDPAYEEEGKDYPAAFVRWTEQRNFDAVLHLFADKSININPLLTKRVPLERAGEAYDALSDKSHIGMIIEYPEAAEGENRAAENTVHVREILPRRAEAQAILGIIGAGGFTQGQVLPALSATPARIKWIASAEGVSGANAARKFQIENNTTDYRRIIEDEDVNAVVITTRHNSHAKLVIESLRAHKHVFVEKPLCLTREEAADIRVAYDTACAEAGRELILMVGFNRRFSPLTDIIADKTEYRNGPLSMVYTANVGYIPPDHWVHDPDVGGGRILGEACHFIDYLKFLAGSDIVSVEARGQNDTAMILLSFADGSTGQVNYLATGNKGYPKEKCEIFFDGKILALDNFRRLRGYGVKGFSKKSLWRQDKGHDNGFAAFVSAIEHGTAPPIAIEDIFSVTIATCTAWEKISGAADAAVRKDNDGIHPVARRA